MYILKRISGFILLATLVWACGTKSNQEAEEEIGNLNEGDKHAICLGNNVSVRKLPSTTGKLITAISIGESVDYLDSIVIDTVSKGKYEYALIRLSDGTQGWAVKTYLFEDTQLLAITEEATIYSRPDLLTATKKSFKPMDLFVITSGDEEAQEGNWLPVTGRVQGTKSFTSGWIKGSNATTSQSDVLVAQLVYKANELKDKRMEELNGILTDEAYSNSIFMNEIRVLLFNDPKGFLKEKYERYYVGMINYYDSADHDSGYLFEDDGPSIDIFGKLFYSYKVGSNCDYCEFYYPWYLFYDFTTFLAADQGYEPYGYYNNYYESEDMLAAMEKLAGIPVYTRVTEDYGDFDRVNPAFVSWVTNNLIPHPDNGFLGMPAQKIYDVVFRANARDTWSQWRYMEYQFDMDELAVSYEDGMSYEEFEGTEFLRTRFRQTGVSPVLAGIFIRRRIDDSYDEVTNAMQKIMTIYDGDWVAEQLESEPYIENENYEDEYYEEDVVEEGEE